MSDRTEEQERRLARMIRKSKEDDDFVPLREVLREQGERWGVANEE